MEGVVERARPVQRRDRLRHARQLRPLRVETEPAGELDRERLGLAAGDDRQPSREEQLRDLLEVLLRRRSPSRRRRLLTQDRGVELPQERPRLEPEALDERFAAFPVDLERVGLAPRAVEREHQLAA